jgi:hypothetical protein
MIAIPSAIESARCSSVCLFAFDLRFSESKVPRDFVSGFEAGFIFDFILSQTILDHDELERNRFRPPEQIPVACGNPVTPPSHNMAILAG